MTQHIDALGDAILGLTAKMNANEYELLVMIREFDERGGWLSWSSQSCADWLHWRCDMSPTTARERVRIAHALKRLPETSKVFSTGRLSYSKVRALTRVATAATEISLIEFALGTSAARVEERCHAQRNGDTASIADARRHRRSRGLETHAHDGMMTISVRVPVEDGELISHALDQAIEQTGPECGDSWVAQRADALVAIAKSYMSGGEESASSCADEGRWYFQRADGRAIPSCGYRPEDVVPDDLAFEDVSAEAWFADLMKHLPRFRGSTIPSRT